MKYIKTINEYRNQLELPFGGKHPLHDKPTHVHVLDALMELSIKDLGINDYNSNDNKDSISKYWNENIQKAFNTYKNSFDKDFSEYLTVFYNTYPPAEYPAYYSDYVVDTMKNTANIDTLINTLSKQGISSLFTYLSSEGQIKIRSDAFTQTMFDKYLQESNVENILKESLTSNGLIPIWRAVAYSKEGGIDTYENTIAYCGVGVYWSYTQEDATVYDGNGGETYILHGLVKPENIQWEQTVFKSAWDKSYEKEVELEEGSEVLIYKITTIDNKVLPLKTSILVNT